ncbi:MAG: hypothetical protein KJ709_01780 [Nanoarchaeota archaeon]|nr:hypothetical protein [Nanoarchaeota archaeon]
MVNILTYVLTLIMVAIAPLIGVLISYFSREELKTGKRFFVIALRFIFVIGVALFSYNLFRPEWKIVYLVLWLVTLAVMVWPKGVRLFTTKSGYSFLVYSFLIGSTRVNGSLLTMGSLLFVAGLLHGSVITSLKLEEKKGFKDAAWKAASDTMWFVVVSIAWAYSLEMLIP